MAAILQQFKKLSTFTTLNDILHTKTCVKLIQAFGCNHSHTIKQKKNDFNPKLKGIILDSLPHPTKSLRPLKKAQPRDNLDPT